MQSVSLAFARAIIDSISTLDKKSEILSVQLENCALTHAGEQIPMSELSKLFELFIHLSRNEDLGLLAYKSAHPGHLGILGYAVMSSSTIGEAITRMVEYHSLVGTGFCMFLESNETSVRMSGLSASSQSQVLPRAFIDAVAAITLGLLRWLAPSSHITPLRAEFSYSRPQDTRELEKMFGCDLRFSCIVNAIVFRRSDMDLAVATSNPSLQQVHDKYLKQCLGERSLDSIASMTKKVVMQHLVLSKAFGLADIAHALRRSNHQLTRSLDKEGQSFQMIVDEVKKQHCCHLLLNTELSLKQVSYSLGFKNSSALNKACERWFGMAPGACRTMA